MHHTTKWIPRGCGGGWEKPLEHAVIGSEFGTTFDMQVRKEGERYRMWFSWRPVRLIAYAESRDGIAWTLPRVVFCPDPASGWERDEVNRPTILRRDGLYHMWYTGQCNPGDDVNGSSAIGYATSPDGYRWERRRDPVLRPEQPWEGIAVMCPDVRWDEERRVYRMWYSGGEQAEPDAIGYAESPDGIHWTRSVGNPIFQADANHFWEMKKVTAGHLVIRDGWHSMFYIGFDGDGRSSVCLARSRDGIRDWQRHPDNPILAGSDGSWDYSGICRVSVVEEEDGYKLWYNGCNNRYEEIGYAVHKGHDLGFDHPSPSGRPCDYRGTINLL